MSELLLPAFTRGVVLKENGLAVYSGAAVADLDDSRKELVAKQVASGLRADPGRTIPVDEEHIMMTLDSGLAVVVFELTTVGTGRPLAFAKIKGTPYVPEKGEQRFGTGEAPTLPRRYEAGGMLGPHSLNSGDPDEFPRGLASVAMEELVQTAAENVPDIAVMAISRKGNHGAARALRNAGGEVFAHKPTKRLRPTQDQINKGQPVWADMYNMKPQGRRR